MKRLLILANSDSAIYKFRRELIDALSCYFHIGIGIPFGQYINDIKDDKYDFFDIPVNRHGMNPIEDIRLMKKYDLVVSSFKPDVVLEYTIKPNLYGSIICSKRNIPCLCNITGLGSALEKKGALQLLLILMYKYSMRKVNTIFFQNTNGKDFFCKNGIGRSEQYVLLPGSGVNLERFSLQPYPSNDIQKFLFVARVIKQKGIDEYLYVAKKFHDLGLMAEFHICGACEEAYLDELNKLHDDGVIVYHGLVKNMTDIYALSTCVVLPSYYPEGQSNVLLEGAATGRPLITTNHPGCREAVVDGETGFIVRIKDPNDLFEKTSKMYYLSSGEREHMGISGRAYVEMNFDRKIVVNKYLERLRKINLI